jgi:hypothetical protein
MKVMITMNCASGAVFMIIVQVVHASGTYRDSIPMLTNEVHHDAWLYWLSKHYTPYVELAAFGLK